MSVITRPAFQTGGWGNLKGIDTRDPSLVLYLPLWYPDSETTGSTIISKDINRHSCTVTGATWGTTGRTFNGTSDNIELPAGSISTFDLANYTLIGWVKDSNTTQANTKVLSNRALGGDPCTFQFGALNATTWDLWWRSSSANKTGQWTVDTSDGLFHHAAVVKASSTAPVFYLDGVSKGSNGSTDDADSPDSSVVIGCSRWGGAKNGFWKGVIGETFIYNRILSAAEVSHNEKVTEWRYR